MFAPFNKHFGFQPPQQKKISWHHHRINNIATKIQHKVQLLKRKNHSMSIDDV